MDLNSILNHKINPLILLFIVGITFLSYTSSLKNGFTEWDDDKYIQKNSLIQDFSVKGIKEIFKTPHVMGNYHPLTITSLAFDYSIDKFNPKIFHWHNLILHLLNTGLLFFLILQLSRNHVIAIVTSVLFGIHPMHVESVAWISERKDVLHTFYFLLSSLAYLKYQQPNQKILFYALTFLLFWLSVLSKAQAVVLPIVFILYDYFTQRLYSWKDIFKKWYILVEKIPFLAISVIYGLKAISAQKMAEAVAKPETFTLLEKSLFACYGTMMYAVKLFVPFKLSHFHPYPTYINDTEKILPLIMYFSPLILLVFAGLIFLSFRKTRAVIFGIGFFLVAIVLMLQFYSVGRAIIAERYTYIPYIGLFFIIGWAIDGVLKNKKTISESVRNSVPLVFVALVITFGYLTFKRCKVWKNEVSIWSDFIEKYPNYIDGYEFRGSYFAKNGMHDLALADFTAWLHLKQKKDELAKAFNSRGKLFGQMKKFNEAIQDFEQAQQLNPDFYEIYFNRALTYCIAGKPQQSFPDFEKALQLAKPGQQKIIFQNRANALNNLGKIEEAQADLNRAQQIP